MDQDCFKTLTIKPTVYRDTVEPDTRSRRIRGVLVVHPWDILMTQGLTSWNESKQASKPVESTPPPRRT